MNELTRRIGKFESPEALLKAYEALTKEFTKRCQRLKEIEKENSDLAQRIADEEFLFNTALRALDNEKFIDEYVLTNERIKERVIEAYLSDILRGRSPATLSQAKGNPVLAPIAKPRNLGEAKRLADIIINS